MTQQEMMQKIEEVLENAKTGVLTNVGEDGRPNLRWMTPATIRDWPGVLFAVTSPHSKKVAQLKKNDAVTWMLQTKTLDQIVTIQGMLSIVDNPSLKMQVMDSIGKRLTMFWNINTSTDFVVLETNILQATWFSPMKRLSETVVFGGKESGYAG